MPARKTRRTPSVKKKRLTPVVKYLILIAFLAIFGFVLWKMGEAWTKRLWKDGSRITIVVANPSPEVFSYNPENASITQFTVPSDAQLDASGGYGSWSAASLWDLGIQERAGGQILARSIQRSFGIPVNGWTGRGGNVLFAEGELGWFSLVNIQSNLTFFDKVNLLLASGRVGRLSRANIDLEQRGVIKPKSLADGTKGFVINPDKSLSELDTLRDDKVFLDQKALKITNAASVSGLAAQVSRVASVLGLRVISTDSTKGKVLGVCTVRGKDSELKSFAARRLVATYGCESEVGDPSGPTNLEIILGAKFAKEY